MSTIKAAAKELKNLFNPYPYRKYMRKNKCIFIHIPKNGGTSILRALGASKGDRIHLNWRVYQQANRFLFDNYFKFAIVRNPYERLVSVYTYLLAGGSSNKDAEISNYLNENAVSFKGFVFEFLSPSRIQMMALLRAQAYYICDEFGRIKVDEVFRLESIEESYPVICRKTGIRGFQHFHENKSSRNSFESYYDEETKQKVFQLYSLDFEIFKYSNQLS